MAQATVTCIKTVQTSHQPSGNARSPGQAEDRYTRLCNAFGELETPIADVRYMTMLVTDAVEEAIGHSKEIDEKITGKPDCIYLISGYFTRRPRRA
jgi:hypothetical protein